MVPQTVTFTGFEAPDVLLVLDSAPQNKPCFWPPEWTIIIEPEANSMGDIHMFAWMRSNCCHRWDVATDNLGRRMYAFEDEDEAMLFRLSF